MNRLLTITSAVLLTFSTYANAQSSKRSNIDYASLGPIAGFGHSWVSGGDKMDFKASGHLGIGLIYSKHEHWGWGADLTVSHEGFKMEDNAANSEMVVNPVYLRLTPKAYYFFGKYGSNIRPKVYLGPSVAYKVDERVTFNDEKLSKDDVKLLTGEDHIFDDIDFGLTAGAGVNIKVAGRTWLNLDASYYHGIIDVTDDGNANRNIRLNVGLLFGL